MPEIYVYLDPKDYDEYKAGGVIELPIADVVVCRCVSGPGFQCPPSEFKKMRVELCSVQRSQTSDKRKLLISVKP